MCVCKDASTLYMFPIKNPTLYFSLFAQTWHLSAPGPCNLGCPYSTGMSVEVPSEVAMHEILYRLRNSGPGLHASNPLANVNNLGRKVAIHCVFQWFVAPEGQIGSLKLAWDHVQWLWAWLLQSPYECVSNAFEPQGPSLAVIWLQGSVLLGRCNTATSRTNLQCIPARYVAISQAVLRQIERTPR